MSIQNSGLSAAKMKKKEHPTEKIRLHPRNKHRKRYDFKELIGCCPDLAPYVVLNNYNDESIDFFNPEAVKMLNKALLNCFYNIKNWDIPQGYLCPPIPGRADYIHNIADLLANCNKGKIPTESKIKCLDIGVGANCVYPIIGNREYGWSFVGSDIDPVSIDSATKIIESNPILLGKVETRLQPKPEDIFIGVIQKDEYFDLTLCNPPFHASAEEAQSGTLRKLSNLKREKISTPSLNFGGKNNELWCQGGEEKFVCDMILQSMQFSDSCFWFTTLISKESNLKSAYKTLEKAKVIEKKTISMGQGSKTSRIIAWTFLSPNQQKTWANNRWNLVE